MKLNVVNVLTKRMKNRREVDKMIFTEEQRQLAYAALMAYGNQLYDMATKIPNESEMVDSEYYKSH